jgi:DNA-binding transcriptional regulator YhcF (GntR family)
MKKHTSLKALETVMKTLPKRQFQVYEKIATFPGITIREVASKLKTFPHAISGRFGELEKKGIIKTCKECKYFKGEAQPHSKYVLTKVGK